MLRDLHRPLTRWQYVSPAEITDTADDVVIAAVAGQRHYVTAVQISNSDIAVGTYVIVKSGSTVLWQGFVSPFVAAAPGVSYIEAAFPVPLQGGVNEAINVACGTTSAQVTFCAQGFTGL